MQRSHLRPALLALCATALASTSWAQMGLQDCGTLTQGVGCTVFEADQGGRFHLTNYGSYVVGDRVHVWGVVLPPCLAICGPVDGCLDQNTIGPCAADQAVSYCVSLPNSTGSAATISLTGSSSIAVNSIVLRAAPVPAGETGLYYYGDSQVAFPFGNGIRCVSGQSGQVFRLFPISVTEPSGTLRHFLNLLGLPSGGAILPGSTWNFQAWFRDPAGGGAGFNLSDGVSISFVL